jgi:hypothetical protein
MELLKTQAFLSFQIIKATFSTSSDRGDKKFPDVPPNPIPMLW